MATVAKSQCSLAGGGGPCSGKKFFLALSPQRGWRKREREERAQHTQSCGCTPSLRGGCPSLLPQGWIPTCAHRAGQRASRTVTIPCPHPKLHNVTCPSYVLLCTCGCLCCTVKVEEKAKPGYIKVGWFVAVFWVWFLTYTMCRVCYLPAKHSTYPREGCAVPIYLIQSTFLLSAMDRDEPWGNW